MAFLVMVLLALLVLGLENLVDLGYLLLEQVFVLDEVLEVSLLLGVMVSRDLLVMLSMVVPLHLLSQPIQMLLLTQGLHLTDLLPNWDLLGFRMPMSLLDWLLVPDLPQRLLLMGLLDVFCASNLLMTLLYKMIGVQILGL